MATSNPEFYIGSKHDEDHEVEEPEAVIVEVEDEVMELTSPLPVPIVQKQIPVLKLDNKDFRYLRISRNSRVLQLLFFVGTIL